MFWIFSREYLKQAMKFPLIQMNPEDKKYEALLKKVKYTVRTFDILVICALLAFFIVREVNSKDAFDYYTWRITDLMKNLLNDFNASVLIYAVYRIRKQILDSRNAEFLLEVRFK